jgi:hypothetical protein
LNGYDIGGSLRGGGRDGVFLISPFSKRVVFGLGWMGSGRGEVWLFMKEEG